MDNYISLIIKTALDRFGITTVKPYQLLVMERILEQEESGFVRNQVVILPTGTGKSLCFQIPAILCKRKTIIIYPILALMADQKLKLDRAMIKSVVIKGGQTKEQREEIFRQLDSGTNIIITNPETLSNNKIIQRLSKYEFELFTVDEAHVIAQWGMEFRPAYSKLRSLIDVLKPHQILEFTATASPETLKTIEHSLFRERPLEIIGDSDRENIFYGSLFTPDTTTGCIEILRTCPKPAIVFCGQRKLTEILCLNIRKELSMYQCKYYHAGLSKQERTKLESWYMDSPDGVLFATSAYGMGIDKSNIRTVIHYTLPSSTEEYLQESGRAGRDGQQAWAWVLISPNQTNSQLYGIFTGTECRRKALLSSLGQEKDECTGCDVCNGNIRSMDYITKQIVKLVKAYPFRFSDQSAAALLSGTRIQWKLELNSTLHPLYGILSMYSFDTILRIIRSTTEIKGIDEGYLYHSSLIGGKTVSRLKSLLYRVKRMFYN